MITLYNIILTIGITVGIPLIIPIILLSEKRRKTFLQRLGVKRLPENILFKRDKPIWIHALSVGEVVSSVPLVMKLKERFKDKRIVFSASTKTGFEVANKLFKKNVDSIFYFPFDLLFSVKYIAGKIDPAIVIIVESDIWPNFLFEMKKRHIPVVLINARLSNRSFKGYKHFPFISNKLFLSFAKICTQSIEDARRFMLLGIPSNMISTTGNIKFDQPYDPVSEKQIETLKQSMHIYHQPVKKILIAGSTHKGEESILIDAFLRIRKDFADTVLIVVPRNPERARSVLKLCKSAGFSSILMKDIENIGKDKKFDVIVVDAIGILKRLYAIADVAFVGGSFVDLGGHNPLEPSAFSKPVIFGQYMSAFANISQMLVDSGGAVQVENTNSLYETTSDILSDRDKALNMGEKAFRVFNANKGAVDKTLKVIENQLKDCKKRLPT